MLNSFLFHRTGEASVTAVVIEYRAIFVTLRVDRADSPAAT